jgi:hypothetical protein
VLRAAHRACSVVLVLLATLIGSLVVVGPARAGTSSDVPTKSDLASLRVQADRAAASLAAGTAALEKVQAKARTLSRKATAAQRRSTALDTQLGTLHKQMGSIAAAAYRNPLGAQTALLITGQGGSATDALQGLGYLNVVSSRRSQVLREAEATRVKAIQARREAEQLAHEAAASQTEATRQVAALKREAAAVGERLMRAMARYEAEQARLRRVAAAKEVARARAAAARARAARASRVVHTGSCAGGGGREWGGYPNGFIPDSALSPLPHAPGHRLRCDAATAFSAMTAAYARSHGGAWICVTDSYRSYSEQQRLYQEKPSLAAVPGTSNHGWALALDLCGGAQRAGSATDQWLHANAPRFGWHHPDWAEPSGSRPEPWHWEFGYIS